MSNNSQLRPLLFNGRLNIVTSAYSSGAYPNREFSVTNSDFLDTLDGRGLADSQTGDIFIDSERYRFTIKNIDPIFLTFTLVELPWDDTTPFDYTNVGGGNGVLFRSTPNCQYYQHSLEVNQLPEAFVHYMDQKIFYQVDEKVCGASGVSGNTGIDSKNFLGNSSLTGVSGTTGSLTGMNRLPIAGDQWYDPITGQSFIFKNGIWFTVPPDFRLGSVTGSDLTQVLYGPNAGIQLITPPTGPTGTSYVWLKTGPTAGNWIVNNSSGLQTLTYNALGGTGVTAGNFATLTYNGVNEANTLLCDQWQFSNGVFNQAFLPALAADKYGNIFLSAADNSSTLSPQFVDRKKTTTNGRTGPQIFIRKLDKQGTWNFYANVSVTGTALYTSSIATNSSGDVYLAAEISGDVQPLFRSNNSAVLNTTTLGTGSGSQIIVAKLSNKGIWQWATRIDAAASNELKPSITVDKNDYVYVAGYGASGSTPIYYNSNGSVGDTGRSGFNNQVFIGKINSDGNWIWNVSVDGLQSSNEINPVIAADSCDSLYMAAEASAGSVPFFYNRDANFGFTGVTGVTAGSGTQIVIGKLSTEGFWDWSAAIDAPTTNEINPSVATDCQGNCYVSGQGAVGTIPNYISSTGTVGLTGIQGVNAQIFLGKIDENGVWQWQVAVDSATNERGSKVRVNHCGYVFLTGVTDSSPATFYGTNKQAAMIGPVGTTPNIFMGKLNTDGVWQWRNHINLSGSATTYDVVGDSLGNVYVAGELTQGTTAAFFNRDDYNYVVSDSGTQGTGLYVGKLAHDTENAKGVGVVQSVTDFGGGNKQITVAFSDIANYPAGGLIPGANYYLKCGTGANTVVTVTDEECDLDNSACCSRRFIGVARTANSILLTYES